MFYWFITDMFDSRVYYGYYAKRSRRSMEIRLMFNYSNYI